MHVGTPGAGTLCGRRMRLASDVALPTCHRCLLLAQRRGGLVYLIHFDRPFSHAQHYMGWTESLLYRLHCHQRGSGANLMRHVSEAGIEWRLVAVYYGDRAEERRMKNHGHARRCPECRLTRALSKVDNHAEESSTASGETKMAKTLDLGDRATGRAVTEDDFHLVRPARRVTGTVVGVYPHSPQHVAVQVVTGERVTIRVGA